MKTSSLFIRHTTPHTKRLRHAVHETLGVDGALTGTDGTSRPFINLRLVEEQGVTHAVTVGPAPLNLALSV